MEECRTSNIAREASLAANVPDFVPATTVSLVGNTANGVALIIITNSLALTCNNQACITSIAAATMAAEKIIAGTAKTVLVGGCETFSDVPIRYRCVLYVIEMIYFFCSLNANDNN